MKDIEKARRLFRDAGLAFPAVPEKLAAKLKERDRWVFSSRPVRIWPYKLHEYIREAKKALVKDYALLSHAGHGINSYAIQYYLVYDSLSLFLHLGWGGGYMDAKTESDKIRDCFSIADQIVSETKRPARLQPGKRLTIVGSDFYGSYWLPPGESRQEEVEGKEGPSMVLTQALDWLKGQLSS